MNARRLLPVLLLLACRAPAEPSEPAAQRACGVVCGADGAPLGGVRYWVSGCEERTAAGWHLVMRSGAAQQHFTTASGRFELHVSPELRVDVDFDAPGLAPAFAQALEAGSETRVVLRRGSDVRGRLVQRFGEQSRAIEHGIVSIQRSNPRGLWFERSVSTDADGVFVFTGILPSEFAGCSWRLSCAGAVLELSEPTATGLPEQRVEISMQAARR